MFKNTPKTYFMGGATPTDMTMVNRGVFFITNNGGGGGGGGGTGWKNKPASWPDIRTNAQDKHIYLLADDRYPLGFTVTCTGGYTVNIDGVKYNDYASGAQFSMQKTNWPADTGYAIDYPTGATKAHIIDIFPQDTTNNITKFKCEGVNNISREEEGILWEHFCLDADIDLKMHLYNNNGYYYNKLAMACTSKDDTLSLSALDMTFWNVTYQVALEYIPTVTTSSNSAVVGDRFVQGCYNLTKVTIKDVQFSTCNYMFLDCYSLKQIDCNTPLQPGQALLANCYELLELPEINLTKSSYAGLYQFITNAGNLKDTVLDVRGLTDLRYIQCYGSSQHFMTGFKGLRVSSSAPFTGVSPQVDVSYTGMDRDALVTLFNDLPTVSNSQKINITGATGSANLSAADVAIATGKGWTVTGGPTFDTYYAYTDSSNNTIYTKNAVADDGTFTLQNATEQGTLTKYGEIYSNFSGNNYVQLDNTYTFRTTSWKISLEFITGTLDTGERETLFNAGYPAGVEISITSDKYFVLATNTNGDTINADHKGTYLVQPYTHYWLEASYDGVAYRLKYSLDGINYVEDVTFESTSKISNQNSPCYLGRNGGNSSVFFNGYMIMSGFKITISDNDYTFGSLTTQPSTLYNSSLQELSPQPYFGVVDAGLANCSKVGSLAENNGVLSNFSTSDYLDLTPVIILGSSWSIKIKVHTSNTLTTNQKVLHFYRSNSSNTNTRYGIGLTILDSGKFDFFVSASGTNWLFDKSGTHIVQPDTDYWLECSYDGTTYKFKYSLDGENYTEDITHTSSSAPYSPLLGQLGAYRTGTTTQSATWTGTIDLKETSLTIGSKFISFYFTNTSVLLLSDYSYYERNSGADRGA